MRQEDKLKEARKLYKTANKDQKYVLESLFPELKESEDERIREWIINDIRYNMDNEPLNNSEYKKNAEKAIAWLEKQGSYQNDVNYNIAESEDESVRGAIIDHLKDHNLIEWASWLKKQGEQKPTPKFKIGDMI